MSRAGLVVDAALEATVAGSFSRAGIAIRSRLLAEFTTDDDRPSLAGRLVVVTGATSGLGQATAAELARRGGKLHFLARDQRRAARTRRQIIAETGNNSVSYGVADIADLESVIEFAHGFAARHDRLDVLIHNAGAMYDRYQVNGTGTELTFAAQVAGPFALTTLLLPQLRAAAPSRVIVVSSGGMYGQPLARSVTPMSPENFRGVTAYARAKRAQVALSAEWARRIPATDIAFHAMHPGWADTPGLAASLPTFRRMLGPALRTPAQGADTTVWLATARPELLGTGRLWHDRRPRREHLIGHPGSHDSALAAALWDQLAALTHPT
ncbi:MAG TPA: SDR family NAD(P)-dependent oxidoreductase [Streptosporangiaceae bacterium]|nr:SDR family NAD(P)-dependent oxidoreductase [Streptosporangiaceae bacterium]